MIWGNTILNDHEMLVWVDVHWVVTEYGAVNLHGKSYRERAKLMISIAHPKFRDELEKYAKEQHIL